MPEFMQKLPREQKWSFSNLLFSAASYQVFCVLLQKLKYFTPFVSHTLLGICFPNALILIYMLWR